MVVENREFATSSLSAEKFPIEIIVAASVMHHNENNSLKRTEDLYEYIEVPLCKSESLSPKILNAN